MVLLTELLPTFSSSSSTQDHNRLYDYDVFLSFRGVDTRNGFTDHLYNALLDAGINTFLDDEEIETGEPLKPELKGAIQSSRASIIILSKNFASSTWCLDELVLILDQKRKFNQIVIPIFYHVEPTDIRKLKNSFEDAMKKHEQSMKVETDANKISQWALKMESWKMALIEVADLKGKDTKDRKETKVIQEVVADIYRRLHVPLSNTLTRLIGMDYNIKLISSWLTDGSSHSADILTIVGMSGIGKTSLARHVFGLHSSQFDKSTFIEGINTKANEHFNGLLDLQKQLHGDISKKMNLLVNDVNEYAFKIQKVLANKRVLIVLDDIGSLKQLDALLGNKGLHPGSKVITTTKDASLTKRCALFKSQAHNNYKEVLLNGLYEYESLELLCSHAFDSKNPKQGYEEVSKKLVKYCDGHPLAIEVLGSSLQNQDVQNWTECIEVLKKEPNSRINMALRMSFDALQYENDKELFKHIACFFVGMDRVVTETILKSCDLKARLGITNLIDKCLLRIRWDNTLAMHSLVQEMGRDLIRQESPMKPWKRSRSWCHEESMQVLKQKKMYYEFGIFSTFYEGKEMPDWITHRSKGPSLSFTIPSSPKKLHGLNFCSVETRTCTSFLLPMIKISNITKNRTWFYKHCLKVVKLSGNKHYYEDGEEHLVDVGKYCLSCFSHWMFGPNEMKAGDVITISVADKFPFVDQYTIQCGIGLVYNEDGRNVEEEDVFDYYKSWNYILGGDLSHFQLTTGEYLLDNEGFTRGSTETSSLCLPYFDDGTRFKSKCHNIDEIW